MSKTKALSSGIGKFTIKNAGKKHNESLEYVYAKLRDSKKRGKPAVGVPDLIREHSAEHAISQGLKVTKEELFFVYDRLGFPSDLKKRSGSATQVTPPTRLLKLLAPELHRPLTQIYFAIEVGLPSADFTKVVSSIVKQSKETLDGRNAEMLEAMANVAG